MLQKIKDRLVDNAKCWYKMWSTWWSVFISGILAAIYSDPTIPSQLIAYVPEQYRGFVGAPVIVAFFSALPIILRLIRQPKLPSA